MCVSEYGVCCNQAFDSYNFIFKLLAKMLWKLIEKCYPFADQIDLVRLNWYNIVFKSWSRFDQSRPFLRQIWKLKQSHGI